MAACSLLRRHGMNFPNLHRRRQRAGRSSANNWLAATKEFDMSFLNDLLEKPASLSAASKYTALNGVIYLASGALLIVWPGAVQTLLFDPPFGGHEEGLIRVVGMAVTIIGWLYLFGGRSGGRQFAACTALDRLILVPAVLIPAVIAGIFPHTFLAFTLLDVGLAIGVLFLRSQTT
jgi:hypothetical protein